MGHIVHHAIVVTSWDGHQADAARRHAVELGLDVTPLITSHVNRYVSFLIGPDGSKSGWPDSDEGDGRRAAWIEWARGQADAEDGGSSYLEWVEVAYGSDDQTARVELHQWDDSVSAPPTPSDGTRQ